MTRPRFDWTEFAAASHDWPPRPLLLKALQIEGPGQGRTALDLGTSSGRDALALAARGWQVTAIDANPDAITALRGRIPEDLSANLQTLQADLTTWPLPPAHLVHAGYTLPFLGDQQDIWHRVCQALPAGGLFVGQFFGPNDDWASESQVTTLTRSELGHLIKRWHRLHYEEKLFTAPAIENPDKTWHLFNLILRKPYFS
ncbi:MAG: hypothetical protein Alpg2KO_18850 [Alphaproteobacteria bacterium]